MEVEEKRRGEKTNSFLLQANFMFLKRLEFSCTIFSLHNSWYNLKQRASEAKRTEKNTFANKKVKKEIWKNDKLQALNFMPFINTQRDVLCSWCRNFRVRSSKEWSAEWCLMSTSREGGEGTLGDFEGIWGTLGTLGGRWKTLGNFEGLWDEICEDNFQ